MNEKIEKHTDGTLWVACNAESPKSGKIFQGINVYHPDAKSTSYGSDDNYECPHCKDDWWVEYDG